MAAPGFNAKGWRVGFGLLALGCAAVGRGQLGFEFTASGDVPAPPEARRALEAAGALWSTRLTDPITVRLRVEFSSLPPANLAYASPTRLSLGYEEFRSRLAADLRSEQDAQAVASLSGAPGYAQWVNRTPDNPHGGGGDRMYLDSNASANNRMIWLTSANARALGYGASLPGASDALLTFNLMQPWDYDPTDGIGREAYDFVGVAAHEIGHALGFLSSADWAESEIVRTGLPLEENNYRRYAHPLDLFRHSAETAGTAAPDGSLDWRRKYFSIDGGATSLGDFSTGERYGDGWQSGHWKNGRGLGLMDPTQARGERLALSELDLIAFDVIGYDRGASAVPEPGASGVFAALLAGAVALVRRRARAR